MARALQEQLSILAWEILDCLADDSEDLKQIQNIMVDKGLSYDEAELRAELKTLIREGYIRCYEPVGYILQKISRPDLRKLNHYWFGLTRLGELHRRR